MCISSVSKYAIKFDNNIPQYNNSSKIHCFDIMNND